MGKIVNIFKLRATKKNKELFAKSLMDLQESVGFRISSRGWCYQLESERLINKDEFSRVEEVINRLRKEGILPIDFVAEEEGRQFSGIEEPTNMDYKDFLSYYCDTPFKCSDWFTPDWWSNEEYYIQMVVEKIDLKTLFEPICQEYHIPIATSKGWSSMLQRAQYARRFKEAEDMGKKCVLLYCGDHDPDGLRISDFLRTNLHDLRKIVWNDGELGYNPDNLIIQRFGLDKDFIEKHGLTWIDNLITGSGRDLGSPSHKNYKLPYVKNYIKTFGKRKCEANAIVPIPVEARKLVREAIEGFLGEDALKRFQLKKDEVVGEIEYILEASGAKTKLIEAKERILNF